MCVAAADDNIRNEVQSVVLTTCRRDGLFSDDSHSSHVVPDNDLEPRRPSSTVDVYTATSVYSEIDGHAGERAPVADNEHNGDGDYEVLDAQAVQPPSPLITVPVYISLLSDAEADETHTNHSCAASATDTRLSSTSDSETKQA